jgi:hypothetical protein
MASRAAFEDRASYRLTRHFFVGLFDFGILSEAGSDSFRRMLFGIAAAMLASGMILTRMYVGKYAWLSGLPTAGPYQLAVPGDEALAIALPMLVVAFATVLVSASLFPDETDFRVLLVLPVSRRMVFASKLLALAIFAGLFVLAAQAALAPLAVMMSAARWAEGGLVPGLGAHAVASVGGSAFVVLAVTALNGLLLMCVPRATLHVAQTVLRSAMLGALVLAVPFVARLPAIGRLIARESPALLLAPPVWFVGVERLLRGHATPYFERLAQIALTAIAASFVIAVVSYTFLYQRFDRVMLRPADASRGSHRRRRRFQKRRHPRREVFAAIGDFTRATLARSPLHQGVLVAVAASGVGLVLNSLVGVTGNRVRSAEQAFTGAVVWTPFVLVFVMTLAVRAALVLPVEPRANWVFRITEDDDTRADQIDAVARAFTRLGVVWPLVVVFPFEWGVLGSEAIRCATIALLSGLVLVELHLGGWRRLPFTCSYLPGKRFVGHTLLIGFTAFAVFTTVGSGLVFQSLRSTSAWLLLMVILSAAALHMRRRRVWQSRELALAFEDAMPNELEPLRLSSP